MFLSLYRIIKMACQNFWRNFWLSIVTISIVALTIFSVNLLLVLNFLTNEASEVIKKKIDISVYLKPDANEEEAKVMRSHLASLPNVLSVQTVLPKEALERFKRKHAEDPEILSSLDELDRNPFGKTFVIKTRNPEDYKSVLSILDSPAYSGLIQDKDFEDHEKLIKSISRTAGKIRSFGIFLSAVFAGIAVLIMFNTIRMAIYTHREEIGIMRLVGASNWFVRGPFLLETVLYSLLSVLLAAAILYPALRLVEPSLVNFFDYQGGYIVNYFNEYFGRMFGLEFLGMAALGIFSSSLAIGRYLRV